MNNNNYRADTAKILCSIVGCCLAHALMAVEVTMTHGNQYKDTKNGSTSIPNYYKFDGATLIPKVTNPAPDYFCTWNVQGYACSYKSTEAQRAQMSETNLFGPGKFQGWVNFFPKVRGDLIFLMDDSWDVPLNGDRSNFGSLILNPERFPSFTGTPSERLEKLVKVVKADGWKGLGGLICAQPAPTFAGVNERDYWTERLQWMKQAGFSYWKVDWGKNEHDAAWRRMLSELGRQEDSDLVIEQAMTVAALGFADVYRTYDVENVVAAPVTIDRVGKLLEQTPSGSPTLINCEDEPYIAAGLGCVMGIMRHPFAGSLPNGQPDMVFPSACRDLKRRLDEVVRAVLWHKIAAPLPLGSASAKVDTQRLNDTWMLERDETWTSNQPGDWRDASAPARISRGLELPAVMVSEAELKPFVLASRSANGAVAIATIGRTIARQFHNPKARITLSVGNAPGPFGIFGYYSNLTLKFDHPLGKVRIHAQDLLADESTDITSGVIINNNELVVPGDLITKTGLSAASVNDLSEPGLVLVIVRSDSIGEK